MKFDQLYMKIAGDVANQSYCKRRKVGAVLVSPSGENIMSYGFNGTISGFPNVCELEDGTTDHPHVLHAETNAIMKSARDGRSTDRATLYTTLSPCVDCSKLIIQSGIARVVYQEGYHNYDGVNLLKRANIEVIQLNK